MRRSLTRTFSVPTAAVAPAISPGFGADLRSADDPDDGRLHAVREQPDSRRAASTRSPRRSCENVPLPTSGAAVPEPRVRRGVDARPRSVQRAPRPPADGRRPAVRPLQHLRRRRAPAVRHERAPGNARARIRPDADDARRGTSWPATRTCSASSLLNEVRFGWMTVEGGQVEPESRQRLRQPGRPARRHERSARHRLPADLDRRALQHDGRPDGLHHARQPALRAVRQLHASIAARTG